MMYNPEIANQLSDLILKAVKARLESQGHVSTGKGLNSLEVRHRAAGEGLVIEILGEEYLAYQDTGRKAGSMPPVEALEKWVKQKRIASEAKEVKRIAFAIAKNMKRIGMHSRNKRIDMSKRGFITKTIENGDSIIQAKLFEMFEKNFNIMVSQSMRDTKAQFTI